MENKQNVNQEQVEVEVVETKKSNKWKWIVGGAAIIAGGFILKAIIGSDTKAEEYVGTIELEDGREGYSNGEVILVSNDEPTVY